MASLSGSCMQEVVLSASSEDDNMHMWDLRTATTLVSYRPSVSASFASQDVVGRDFIAVSQATKPSLQLFSWRKDQPHLRCALPEKIVSLASNPSGTYLIGGGATGRLFLWEVAGGAMLRTWEGHYRSIGCICFTDDGAYAVTCSEDSLIRVWNMGTLLDYGTGHHDAPSAAITWNEHTLPVSALAVGAGGAAARLASASLDRTVRLWHIPTAACLACVQFPSPLTSLALHPADHFLCAGGADGTVYSADLLAPLPSASGTPSLATAAAYAGHTAAVLSLSLSWDGSVLVSGSRDGTARVWDTASGQTLKTFVGHRGPVTYVRAMLRPPELLDGPAAGGGGGRAGAAATPFAALARRPELDVPDSAGYAGPDRRMPVAAHGVCEAAAPVAPIRLGGGGDAPAPPRRVRPRIAVGGGGGGGLGGGGAGDGASSGSGGGGGGGGDVTELRAEVAKWRKLAAGLRQFVVDRLFRVGPLTVEPVPAAPGGG